MVLLISLLLVNIFLREYIKRSHSYFTKLLWLIGMPLHEAAHYFMAKLTFREVISCKFIPSINVQPAAFVAYKNGSSLFSKVIDLLIGMAPMYLGVITLYLIGPVVLASHSLADITLFAFHWLVVLAITQCMIPSWQDVKNSMPGMLILFILSVFILAITGLEISLPYVSVIMSIKEALSILLLYQLTGAAFIKLRLP